MIKITSEGIMPSGVKVTDEKGNQIDRIKSIDIKMHPGEEISAQIALSPASVYLYANETFKSFFHLNVNEKVSVTLTNNGLDILKEYSSKLDFLLNTKDNYAHYEQYLEGNILTMQLWEIMNIFGSSFILGSPPPFTDIAFEKTT